MKAPYKVQWWDSRSDSAQTRGFHVYVEALEFEFKMKGKWFATNVQLKAK